MACIRMLTIALPRFARSLLKQNARNPNCKNLQKFLGYLVTVLPQERFFCSGGDPQGLCFNDVFKFVHRRKSRVIDVRDTYEVENTGLIPGSVNVPLRELEYALGHLSDAQFHKQYGCSKPRKGDAILFYCKHGSRAREAANKAKAMGYSKVKFYIGGYEDWIAKTDE